MAEEKLEALLQETRLFKPPADFVAQANVNDPVIYEEAAENSLEFWAKQADRIDWFERWNQVLEWNPPFAKWFAGGKLNAAYNCIDRHLSGW